MPNPVYTYQPEVHQSALGRALEETQTYNLAKQNIKFIRPTKGSIKLPFIVKKPGNTYKSQ